MQQLQPQLLRNQLHRQVWAGHGAGGAVTEFAGAGLGPRHKMRPAFELRVGRHDQTKGVTRDVQHLADDLDRVPAHFGGVGHAKHP